MAQFVTNEYYFRIFRTFEYYFRIIWIAGKSEITSYKHVFIDARDTCATVFTTGGGRPASTRRRAVATSPPIHAARPLAALTLNPILFHVNIFLNKSRVNPRMF